MCACAHEETRKRVRASKLSGAKKVGKTKKRGKQNKNSKKKIGKRNRKTEREAQQEVKYIKAKSHNKKRAENTKNCAKLGIMVAEKSAKQTVEYCNEQNQQGGNQQTQKKEQPTITPSLNDLC